jgi:hypothetical protein
MGRKATKNKNGKRKENKKDENHTITVVSDAERDKSVLDWCLENFRGHLAGSGGGALGLGLGVRIMVKVRVR